MRETAKIAMVRMLMIGMKVPGSNPAYFLTSLVHHFTPRQLFYSVEYNLVATYYTEADKSNQLNHLTLSII